MSSTRPPEMKTGVDRFILFLDDSGTWWAAPPNFEETDPIGMGKTPREAMNSLLHNPFFQERVFMGEWKIPAWDDFVRIR
jgi:hypothetical protein